MEGRKSQTEIFENTGDVDNMVNLNRLKRNSELHHDYVAQEALGGTTDDLGASYWRSPRFMGTLVVSNAVCCNLFWSSFESCTPAG